MNKSMKLATAAMAALCIGAFAAGAAGAADAAYNPKDLSGVWMQSGGGKFGPYPFTPPYQAIADKRHAAMLAGNPYQPSGSSCLPRGLVGMLTNGAYPLEIFQTAREIAINKENGGMHRIYLNRKHLGADDLSPLFFGDSVGHWEGDILVVDTISLGATDNIDGQNPHSDAMHVVQKFHRIGKDALDVELTVDDPKAFTKPVNTVAHFKADPGYEMQEYYCVNDRNVIGGDGQTIAGVAK